MAEELKFLPPDLLSLVCAYVLEGDPADLFVGAAETTARQTPNIFSGWN